MDLNLRRRWMSEARTRLILSIEQASKTSLGKKLHPGAELPSEVATPCHTARVIFRSIASHFAKRVYLIDFYGSRQALTRNLKQLLAETGVQDLKNDDEVWKYVRQEFAGRIVPCPHSCLHLRQRIAEFEVMCATIQGTGLWMDAPSVMLLAEKSSNEDLANVLAEHRERNAYEFERHLMQDSLIRLPQLELGGVAPTAKAKVIFVVDTSILLNRMSVFYQRHKQMKQGIGNMQFDCTYYIPWVVIKEIQMLAETQFTEHANGHFHPISNLARIAQSKILEERDLTADVFSMERRQEFEASLQLQTTLRMRSISSVILLSCLAVIRRTLFPENCHGRIVLLLSDDWELMADAAMHGIASCPGDFIPNEADSMFLAVERSVKLLKRAKVVLGLKSITTNSEWSFSRSVGFRKRILDIEPGKNSTFADMRKQDTAAVNSEFRNLILSVDPEEQTPTSIHSDRTLTSVRLHSDVHPIEGQRHTGANVSQPPVRRMEQWIQGFFSETVRAMEVHFGPAVQFWLQVRFPDCFRHLSDSPMWRMRDIISALESRQTHLPTGLPGQLQKLNRAATILSGPCPHFPALLEFTMICLRLTDMFAEVLSDVCSNTSHLPGQECNKDGKIAWRCLAEATSRMMARSAFLDGVHVGSTGTPMMPHIHSMHPPEMESMMHSHMWETPLGVYCPHHPHPFYKTAPPPPFVRPPAVFLPPPATGYSLSYPRPPPPAPLPIHYPLSSPHPSHRSKRRGQRAKP